MGKSIAIMSPEQHALLAHIEAMPDPDLTDPDNPEWTAEDFARATGPESLSAVELAAFPNTLKRLGRPPSPSPKRAVKLRLDADVLDRWRASGPGWQTRMNDTLRRALG